MKKITLTIHEIGKREKESFLTYNRAYFPEEGRWLDYVQCESPSSPVWAISGANGKIIVRGEPTHYIEDTELPPPSEAYDYAASTVDAGGTRWNSVPVLANHFPARTDVWVLAKA